MHLRVYVRKKDKPEDAEKTVVNALEDFEYEVDGVYDLKLGLSEI